MLKSVKLPEITTYIGAFLTFRCGFHCEYCINRHGELSRRKELTSEQWIEGLNRLDLDKSLMVPITLQGGEPSKHPGWLDIISGIKDDFYIDLLTNMEFDVIEFIHTIPPKRLWRDVPYASIRASYHPVSNVVNLVSKVSMLHYQGYHVGIWAVDHPESDLRRVRDLSKRFGVDFRTKEFLGWHDGKLYGEYKYTEAVHGERTGEQTQCKSNELLIAPDGSIHKCHRDLYAGEHPLGNVLDNDLVISHEFRECDNYGLCNLCDVKIKNNRFQEFGACSVEIKHD